MTKKQIIIPELVASLLLNTDLEIQEVAEQIGQALDITFKQDTEGLYEEIEALVAYPMGHILAIYINDKNSNKQFKSQIYLDLVPGFYPADINLKLDDCKIIYLYIADYLAALLNRETGLYFEALPPVTLPPDVDVDNGGIKSIEIR